MPEYMPISADIIVRGKETVRGTGNLSDSIYIFVQNYGIYYSSVGVIATLIKAYNNLACLSLIRLERRHTIDTRNLLNENVRKNVSSAAASIIHAGFGSYFPVSQLEYKQYAERVWPTVSDVKYIVDISDNVDQDGDIIWQVTLKYGSEAFLNRTLKEWQKFSEIDLALEPLIESEASREFSASDTNFPDSIKDSIHLGEVDPKLLIAIYRDVGPCPCDTCITRAMCVKITWTPDHVRYRDIPKVCEIKADYALQVKRYFLQKILYDKNLYDLLEKACSDLYMP